MTTQSSQKTALEHGCQKLLGLQLSYTHSRGRHECPQLSTRGGRLFGGIRSECSLNVAGQRSTPSKQTAWELFALQIALLPPIVIGVGT